MRIDSKIQAYPGTSVFRQTHKSKKAGPCRALLAVLEERLFARWLPCLLPCLLACLPACSLAGSLAPFLACSLAPLLACLPGHTSLRELSREKKTGGWEKNPSENNVPILSWHFILHSIWHSIWHLFWHSTILAFYYSVPFWHSICRSIWHSLLAFYLPFYLTFFAGILSGIYSDILLCSIPAF